MEMRLQHHFPVSLYGGGFVMFGITAKAKHWKYPCIGISKFGFGLGGLGGLARCVTLRDYR
ncbi:hypothetical protein CEK25_012182 [Fusarium fujikuroi]|nr:hypothetical protein CEK25_012182 [Fusarium fujikuroi]